MTKQIISKYGTAITIINVPRGLNESTYNDFVIDASSQLAVDSSEIETIANHLNSTQVKDTMLAQGKYFPNDYLMSFHRVQTEYVEAVSSAFGELQQKFGTRVQIDSEQKKFDKLSRLAKEDTGEEISPTGYRLASAGTDYALRVVYPDGAPDDCEMGFVNAIKSGISTSFEPNNPKSISSPSSAAGLLGRESERSL